MQNRTDYISKNWDEIHICELEVFAHHGVFPEETRLGQKFFVNAVLQCDTQKAGRADALELSTDYGAVCSMIHTFLQENTYQLLEAAAENLAEKLLLSFPLLHGVTLEIRKPSAPIPFSFASVSVKISRCWKQAVIACGSNMGDKRNYMEEAIQKIQADAKCRICKCAEWIETKPYGGVEQDDFLNGAFLMETLYEPEELLAFLHVVEKEAGRERLVHWGPRTLDLDIIFYEDEVIMTENLTIPHEDMQNRDFVLKPLAEIVPGWVHPLYQMTVTQLLKQLEIQ